MSDLDEPERVPPGKTINLFVSEEYLEGSSRRTNLALALLDTLSDHDSNEDSSEDSTAEAVAVFITTAAYLLHSFKAGERKAVSDFRSMYRTIETASARLGPRATARDIFTEIAVMAGE